VQLSERIINYLKRRQNSWVSRSDIYRVAKKQGVPWGQVKESLDVLENELFIGKTYDIKTGEIQYQSYDVSIEETKRWKKQQLFFGSLAVDNAQTRNL